MKKKTILVVDDKPSNLDIITELLQDYDVIDTTSGKDAIEIAQKEHIDLILLDRIMPQLDGYEVCKILKSNEKTKNIPIIFLISILDENSIEEVYKLGGSDYIAKPIIPAEIKTKIKKEFKIQDMIRELRLIALTDPMTKLYNRRYFNAISTHFLALAKREKRPLSIIMLDIDKFKKINDTYGHQVGDKVIIRLASLLTYNQRKSDVVCRFGGEEFVMLLPNTSKLEAKKLAENIRKRVEADSIPLNSNKTINFTVSIGVSEVDLYNDTDIEKAIRQADDALYQAKESGRNKVEVA